MQKPKLQVIEPGRKIVSDWVSCFLIFISYLYHICEVWFIFCWAFVDQNKTQIICSRMASVFRPQNVFCVVVSLSSKLSSFQCTSGFVVECLTCNREVAGLNLGQGYFAPRSTQPSIPPGSVNEYQLWLRRQRQVWLILLMVKTWGVQVKLCYLLTVCAIPERHSV